MRADFKGDRIWLRIEKAKTIVRVGNIEMYLEPWFADGELIPQPSKLQMA